jgi:pyridoxal phosphate enzyme (YggS family)
MVAENIDHIRARIAAACERAGRRAGEVTLVAVAKTFAEDRVLEAVRAGVTDIGENYVQEFLKKREILAQETIRWHFIGHLQTRKAPLVVERVALVHSVDSLRLGTELSRCAARIGRTVDVLVEVNTSGEATKYGVPPPEAPGLVRALAGLPGVRVTGLMTIGPFLPDPEDSRGAFRTLASVRRDIERSGIALEHLSMGMTNDFEVAIEEGATIVRIGTAIFGRRTTKQNA